MGSFFATPAIRDCADTSGMISTGYNHYLHKLMVEIKTSGLPVPLVRIIRDYTIVGSRDEFFEKMLKVYGLHTWLLKTKYHISLIEIRAIKNNMVQIIALVKIHRKSGGGYVHPIEAGFTYTISRIDFIALLDENRLGNYFAHIMNDTIEAILKRPDLKYYTLKFDHFNIPRECNFALIGIIRSFMRPVDDLIRDGRVKTDPVEIPAK